MGMSNGGKTFEETRDYALIVKNSAKGKIGPNGNIGDVLEGLLIVPETTAAGTVSIFDSTSGTQIDVFVSGTLSNLTPILIPLGIRSIAGGWFIVTGDHVHVVAVGRFT